MVAMNKYTIGYAKSLVAATPQAQLAEGYRPKSVKGLSSEQVALMERESANLDREFRIAEQSCGTDHLDWYWRTAISANSSATRGWCAILPSTSRKSSSNSRSSLRWKGTGLNTELGLTQLLNLTINGDPDPTSAGTAGEAARQGGSSAVVGMAANPLGAH